MNIDINAIVNNKLKEMEENIEKAIVKGIKGV